MQYEADLKAMDQRFEQHQRDLGLDSEPAMLDWPSDDDDNYDQALTQTRQTQDRGYHDYYSTQEWEPTTLEWPDDNEYNGQQRHHFNQYKQAQPVLTDLIEPEMDQWYKDE